MPSVLYKKTLNHKLPSALINENNFLGILLSLKLSDHAPDPLTSTRHSWTRGRRTSLALPPHARTNKTSLAALLQGLSSPSTASVVVYK